MSRGIPLMPCHLVAAAALLLSAACSSDKPADGGGGFAGSGGGTTGGPQAGQDAGGSLNSGDSSDGGSGGGSQPSASGAENGGDPGQSAGDGGASGSGPHASGDGGQGDVAPSSFFPGWPDPAADQKMLVDGSEKQTSVSAGAASYQCTERTYDVTKQFDRVLGLSTQFVDTKPGALLEGKPLQDGQFVIIPGARRPITLSIDLPITDPVREVTNPNSANIQAAIASLQLQVDAELTSQQLRSNFTHSVQRVESFEDASFYFGVDLKYSGPLASAGLSTTFESQRGAGDQYWAVKHIEEMYTITFADDAFTTLEDFFPDGQGQAQLAKLALAGLIDADNPPVFVKSVTFGRLVMATSVAHQQYITKDFDLTLEGGGFGFSGDTSISDAYKNLASSASFQLLALGGTAEEAASALHNAKIEDMFGPAQAKTAQALYYSLRFAQGERRVAKVGSTTTYTEQTCGQCVTCPDGWTFDTDCKLAQHDAGQATVWEDNGLHTSGGFSVPSGAGVEKARLCIDAHYNTGGLADNADHAFDVYCGNYRMAVARNEVTGNNYAHHKQWCWDDLPVGTSCGADNLGTNWTPWPQGAGKVDITFTVDYYSGSPTCSE